MTAVLPDSDQIAHLDWKPVCEALSCRNNHPPATHIAHVRCGCQRLLCQPCTDITKAAIATNLHADKATCKHCGRVFYDVTTRQLYVSIQPL